MSFALAPSSARAAAPTDIKLSDSPLDKEIATIMPAAGENKWMEIPWRTNIVDALEEAKKVNKPVFYWVMNGNPLGCA